MNAKARIAASPSSISNSGKRPGGAASACTIIPIWSGLRAKHMEKPLWVKNVQQETSTTGVKQTTGKRQTLYNLKEIDLNGNRQTGNELTPPGGAHYLALELSSTGTI